MPFGPFGGGWVTSTVVFWGAIVLFVFISSLFRYLTRSSQHRMLEKLAEKGQTLSPELLSSLGNGSDRRIPSALDYMGKARMAWDAKGAWLLYGWYYITQARFQQGGPSGERGLIKRQRPLARASQ